MLISFTLTYPHIQLVYVHTFIPMPGKRSLTESPGDAFVTSRRVASQYPRTMRWQRRLPGTLGPFLMFLLADLSLANHRPGAQTSVNPRSHSSELFSNPVSLHLGTAVCLLFVAVYISEWPFLCLKLL